MVGESVEPYGGMVGCRRGPAKAPFLIEAGSRLSCMKCLATEIERFTRLAAKGSEKKPEEYYCRICQ